MTKLTRRQAAALVGLTLVWGLNWPVMKLGVAHMPPLTFRAVSMLLALPLLTLALMALKVPLGVPRRHWAEMASLTLLNLLLWNVLVILALPHLSSGRAAILGYTMPVFSALWGRLLYGERLRPRQAAGVAAAGLGVLLLLWHEAGRLAGSPWAAVTMLVAAATWGLGTQRIRRTTIDRPTATLALWMTIGAAVVTTLLAFVLESDRWSQPLDHAAMFAIGFNAVLVFVFAQVAWLTLARELPPIASTLSVMAIPVLGTVAGALWLGEQLHWQDAAAAALMGVAIASVLWPARART